MRRGQKKKEREQDKEEGEYYQGGEVAILNKTVRVDLIEKVSLFKQRNRCESVNCRYQEDPPGKENSSGNSLKV